MKGNFLPTPSDDLEALRKAWKALTLTEILASPGFQALMEARRELVRLATPIYVEMLCSVPFYKEREHDAQFWSSYIGSRVTEAQELVKLAEEDRAKGEAK